MKILLTGATGFIGQRLSKRLIAAGHDLIQLSEDISKPFTLGINADCVIHLAAYNITNIGSQDNDRYEAVNVQGTKNLLEAVNTKRFIYLSTAKVYKNEGRELLENSPLHPQDAYAQSKLKAEELCRNFFAPQSLVVFRSVNVIGWGQAIKAVLPVFFQRAKDNQSLDLIYGAGVQMQFIYVEDVIDAIEAAIHHPEVSGIFNLAYPTPISLGDLAQKIIQLTHSSSVIKSNPEAKPVVLAPVVCDKAHQQLGWVPKTNLDIILDRYNQAYAKA